MRYTFGLSMVVKGFDVFALPDHSGSLFCDIHDGQDILPFVLFAKEEFVLGREGNSATFANQTNEGHLALSQPKIAHSPIVVSGWIAELGAGSELLWGFALQGRQTMHGIDGSLHARHGLVKLLLRFEGVRTK